VSLKKPGVKSDEQTLADRMDEIHISTTLVAGANRRILARVRDHEMVMDVPKQRGGDDAGPTPPECLAMALGGCILNLCRILAMQKQIHLEDLRVLVEGTIDPSRAFGIPTETRAGFLSLSVHVKVASNLTDSDMEEFRRELIRRCPICDTIGSVTPLQITFAK